MDAYRLLDWEPRVTLSEGLARTVTAWANGREASVPARWSLPPRQGCCLAPLGDGLVFNVLDRRDPLCVDRRGLARGGRRASDRLHISHVPSVGRTVSVEGVELGATTWGEAL